jgi:hypothetical protein
MSDLYILDDLGRPMRVDDPLVWASWYRTDRIVEQTVVDGRLFVSTVFLGLDHSFGHGPPILWETMIFKHEDWQPTDFSIEQYCERYTSHAKAERGHRLAVAVAERRLAEYDAKAR